MEARIARLEVAVEHLQQDVKELKEELRALRRDLTMDFRLLFGTIIFVTLGLSGLMAKGFHWL